MNDLKIKCPNCSITIELSEKVENEIYNFFYEKSNKKIENELHKKMSNEFESKLEKEKNAFKDQLNDYIYKTIQEKNILTSKITELKNINTNIVKEHSLELQKMENEYKISLNEEIRKIENGIKTQIDILKEQNTRLILTSQEKEIEMTKNFDEKLKQTIHEQKDKLEKLINDKDAEIAKISLVNNKLTEELAKINETQKNEFNSSKIYGISSFGGTLEEYCKDKYLEECDPEIQKFSLFYKDTKVDDENEKGDFIYRLFLDEDKKIEITSIMFEMKRMMSNENKKNTSFLEKLNRNRINKKCKYAVLVSTYEPENEIYNNGFKDMSGIYENTYIIRPKQIVEFIKFIVKFERDYYKLKLKDKENDEYKLSLINLEETIHSQVTSILKTSEAMDKNLDKVEASIDAAIKQLSLVKDTFTIFKNRLNSELPNKLHNLELKKLVNKNPIIKQKLIDEKAKQEYEAEITTEE